MTDFPYEVRRYAYSVLENSSIEITEALAMQDLEVDWCFEERLPAIRRKQFETLKLHLHPGDTLYVWKLERFGLDAIELLEFLEKLKKRGVTLICLRQKGGLDDFIRRIKRDLGSTNPMAGNTGVALKHLYEIEARASKLSEATSKADAETAQNAEALKGLVGDLRQHLNFIKQQIHYGEHAAAVGRIDNISADF
ncbi:recombinase family protein [uncultured Roseibium sp.]|uniref:recombinase family protein n=1 Tax=uncultured Roseibium sp. TaxID=1936171 RepID=UPI00262B1D5F|nr:recombinase family protein [uncultured Roseibium sp.]